MSPVLRDHRPRRGGVSLASTRTRFSSAPAALAVLLVLVTAGVHVDHARAAVPAYARTTAPKSPAKKSPAKKPPAKKSPARKSPAAKSPARTSGPVQTTPAPPATTAPTTTPPPLQCTPEGGQTIPNVTQAQSNYLTQLAPSTAWPIARGGGVLVALLDTGVAGSVGGPGRPLAGRLRAGLSFADDTDHVAGLLDCDGQGTGDAGLIAASDVGGGLPGIAPDATVLSIRVQPSATVAPKTAAVVKGITAAVNARAGVIVISAPCAPSAALAGAVRQAVRAGIVVLAAVGDPNGASTATGPATSYPAMYPGVLGVAAAPSSGSSVSVRGSFVDLVAPASSLAVLAAKGAGLVSGSGSARAAALAGGTAALVRSAYPSLTLAQLTTRLEYSADHPGGAVPDTSQGWGTVNPYAALTLPIDNTAPPTPAPESRIARVVLPPPDNPHHRYVGAAWATVLVIAALAASGALAAIRRGRRRGWRPAQPTHR